MIKAIIYIEQINNKLAWILDLSFEKEGQLFNKKIKDVIDSKDEMNEPFLTLIQTIKTPQKIELISNYKYIIDLANSYKGENVISADLCRDGDFFKELKNELHEVKKEVEINSPDVPSFVRITISDIKKKIEEPNEFNIQIGISVALLKIAGYFLDNETKVFEFPLFKELKENGLIPHDYEVEDVLMTVVEAYE